MRKAEITLLTVLYVLITGLSTIIGAMIEKSNDNIITKSIGYEVNSTVETKTYPPIYLGK